MKEKRKKRSSFSIVGAICFFVMIAFIMQMAILVYDYIRQKTDDRALISILILVVILILSAICVVIDYFRRKFTDERSAAKILEATDKIAAGDFSVRLEITHDYDKYNQYDLIMENLNKMADELQKSEVLKMDFISNVSHEIKTPLAVIQNYATLLQDESVDKETRKKYAETLIGATMRITNLITNILKLNKLENQEIREKNEEFNLSDALGDCVLEFENAIDDKEIELECDFDDVTIFSCKSLLDIVWTNFLSNAVKFTDNGGKITVSLKQIGKDVKVSVSDNGLGMSPEVGAHIFDKFYQGDASRSSQGNGLGLALVKKVIDILGGEISVQSELGKGSTFSVLLKEVVCEKVSE